MMLINPLTRQVLNANPNGDNQYVNPDGPSRRLIRMIGTRGIGKLPPVKSGHVRFYHGIRRNPLGKIEQEGLKTGAELGTTHENAPVVFGLTSPHFDFGDTTVVGEVPESEIIRAAGSSEVRVKRSVKPEELIASIKRPKFKTGDVVEGLDARSGEKFYEVIQPETSEFRSEGWYPARQGREVHDLAHKLRKIRSLKK